MDDILPAKVRASSFAYLLVFAVAGASALTARHLDADASRSLHEVWFFFAAIPPLVLAMLGTSWWKSLVTNVALCAVAFGTLLNGPYVGTLSGAVARTLLALLGGGLIAGFIELLAHPLTSRIRATLRDGRRRDVPAECMIVVVYGTMAQVWLLRQTFEGPHSRFTTSEFAVVVVCAAAVVVSFTWELRLRMRVRAIVAGRVPGWRAVEFAGDARTDVPMLRKLDDLGCARAVRATDEARRLAIVRDVDIAGGAYRAQLQATDPYVFVPRRITLTCLRSVIWGAVFLVMLDASFALHDAFDEEVMHEVPPTHALPR